MISAFDEIHENANFPTTIFSRILQWPVANADISPTKHANKLNNRFPSDWGHFKENFRRVFNFADFFIGENGEIKYPAKFSILTVVFGGPHYTFMLVLGYSNGVWRSPTFVWVDLAAF